MFCTKLLGSLCFFHKQETEQKLEHILWSAVFRTTAMAAICGCLYLVTISIGHVLCSLITNDTTFCYQQLSKYPSKLVTIEFSVQYQYNTTTGPLILDIYTDKHDADECLNRTYGQLRNRNLNQLLVSPHTACKETNNQNGFMASCNGKLKVQDYRPRNYAFSLGFNCHWLTRSSLEGVMYNIRIYDQNNRTTCEKIPQKAANRMSVDCSDFYSYTSFPNLMGDLTLDEGIMTLNQYFGRYQEALASCGISYFKLFPDLFCYSFIPECNTTKNEMIPPCREMYSNFLSAFPEIFPTTFNVFDIDFEYLPSQNGTIPCFYKEVTCGLPPEGNMAVITNGGNHSRYSVNSRIVYECDNFFFAYMYGDPVSICLYNGNWSSLPHCESIVGIFIGGAAGLFVCGCCQSFYIPCIRSICKHHRYRKEFRKQNKKSRIDTKV